MSRRRAAANRQPPAEHNPSPYVYRQCDYPIRPVCSGATNVNRQAWYGIDPKWRCALEYDAERRWGPYRVVEETGRGYQVGFGSPRLSFNISIEVFGRTAHVPVQIDFWQMPVYALFGQEPRDYPRVYSEVGKESAHRMPDDSALCLWYPADPPERRWTHHDGLGRLLDIVQDHLAYEAHWRSTGGIDGGVWLGDQAAHGIAPGDDLWRVA